MSERHPANSNRRQSKLDEFDRAIRVGGSCPVCADRPGLVGKLECPRCGKKPRGRDLDG